MSGSEDWLHVEAHPNQYTELAMAHRVLRFALSQSAQLQLSMPHTLRFLKRNWYEVPGICSLSTNTTLVIFFVRLKFASPNVATTARKGRKREESTVPLAPMSATSC